MKLFDKLSPFLIKICFSSIFYFFISLESDEYLNPNFYFNLFVFYTFYLGTGFFGYLINDISDEDSDLKAGKTNVTSKLSSFQKFGVLSLLFSIGFFPITFLSPKTLVFVTIEYFLLIIYSFRPLRLKERGIIGVITDSLYAYFIPSLILLTYLSSITNVNSFYWIFLPSLSLFLGVGNILNHQLEDYDNDLFTQTKTFAINNLSFAKWVRKMSILISVVIFLIATFWVLNKNFSLLSSMFFVVTSFVYITKIALHLIFKNEKYLSGIPEFSLIYYGVLLITISTFVLKEFNYLFISIFFILPLINQKLKSTSVTLWFIFIQFYILNRRIASFIVNYSLYFSFLVIGIDLKKRAAQKQQSHSPQSIDAEPISLIEKNVHGLWIGKELSPMELLTISSFISNGYKFHLWVYESLKTRLPEGCILSDANIILPRNKIFKYKYSSQFGTGKGSYAGFSDIFRYKLLHDVGGWWVDMDVTCLKPFDVVSPYFFRGHHDLPLVGNIMKAPKGSLLMKRCYEEAVLEVNEFNRDWHKPISILVKNVFELNLEGNIVTNVNNSDEWHIIKLYVENLKTFPDNWYFMHWCNEVWRTNGYSKQDPLYFSTYGRQLTKYDLLPKLNVGEMRKHDSILKFRLFMDKVNDFL